MSFNTKYANLPDLDPSPDVYETPELTDDASTNPTSATPTNELDDSTTESIDRQRLQPSAARTFFQPSIVSANDVDFSDRIDNKRKSYRTSTRRRRRHEDGTEELGDLSDEEDESLERKVARLRREVEECKEEYARRRAERESQGEKMADMVDEEQEDLVEGEDGGLKALSMALSVLTTTTTTASTSASGALVAKLNKPTPQFTPATTAALTPTPPSQPPLPSAEISTPSLTKAALLETRLTALESLLGLPAALPSSLDPSPTPTPILPTLANLTNQITTVSSATPASLDAIARRVRQLTSDAQKLEASRRAAKEAESQLLSSSSSLDHDNDTTASDSETEKEKDPTTQENDTKTTKLHALYALLPTIETLSPLLPPLLARLRSLHSIHLSAGQAGQLLDEVEKKQEDLDKELKVWGEGLEKLEGKMEAERGVWKGNVGVVEGWVKELEGRVEGLEK
ncbi:MAG: hypothetical protein M1834_000675 [Cirrosporium novae-zelandiae]|nr:MAG: hypothetical protein M1834_000675 [Cirrosporium novae-zelandiae]